MQKQNSLSLLELLQMKIQCFQKKFSTSFMFFEIRVPEMVLNYTRSFGTFRDALIHVLQTGK